MLQERRPKEAELSAHDCPIPGKSPRPGLVGRKQVAEWAHSGWVGVVQVAEGRMSAHIAVVQPEPPPLPQSSAKSLLSRAWLSSSPINKMEGLPLVCKGPTGGQEDVTWPCHPLSSAWDKQSWVVTGRPTGISAHSLTSPLPLPSPKSWGLLKKRDGWRCHGGPQSLGAEKWDKASHDPTPAWGSSE